MDKGTITALKLAGYVVRRTRDGFGEKCWEWLLDVDADWLCETESDCYFDTQAEAWDDAMKHLQIGVSQ